MWCQFRQLSPLLSLFLSSQKYKQNWMKLHGFCILVLMQKCEGFALSFYIQKWPQQLSPRFRSSNTVLSTATDSRCPQKAIGTRQRYRETSQKFLSASSKFWLRNIMKQICISFFLFLFWTHLPTNSFCAKCIRNNNGLNLVLKEVGIILPISVEVLREKNYATWPTSLLVSLQMQAISPNLCRMRISKRRILVDVPGFLSPCSCVLFDSCSPSL